ncbi:GATA zinc finger domain-containing protein 14-like [Pecten maximus]|uniref:GATA zinc finger domain-containing protein 14-like n=1 Tax=Pecten maximus TaxID=6579 RepID=UPI001458C5FB|nr:GATA zinc finger domain-containing protein 14-like [Pecten maximus]
MAAATLSCKQFSKPLKVNARQLSRGGSRINIGKQMNRWLALKAGMRMWKNEEVAKMLLDSWSSVNGIILDDGSELPAEEESSDTEVQNDEPEVYNEIDELPIDNGNLPILERRLEDWEISASQKTPCQDVVPEASHVSTPVAEKPDLKSPCLLEPTQTLKQTESHQHIQISPPVKNQVHDCNQKGKIQIVKTTQNIDLQGLLNAVPIPAGAIKHLVLYPQTGVLIVFYSILSLGQVTQSDSDTSPIIREIIKQEPVSEEEIDDNVGTSKQVNLEAEVISSSHGNQEIVKQEVNSSHGNQQTVKQEVYNNHGNQQDVNQILNSNLGNQQNVNQILSCNYGNQQDVNQIINSNHGNKQDVNRILSGNRGNQQDVNQIINSNHGNKQDVNQILNGNHGNQQDVNQIINSNHGNKQDVNQILNSNHGNKQDAIQILRSDNETGEAGDDIVLNMYCSSDDDADDESDESDEKTTTPNMSGNAHKEVNQAKIKYPTTEAKQATRKRGTNFSSDADGAVMSPSRPKKVHLESDDTVNSYRSERLRKRGKISFVELLKGNVVFKKNRKGEIYAKEREGFSETESSGKTEPSKGRLASVTDGRMVSTSDTETCSEHDDQENNNYDIDGEHSEDEVQVDNSVICLDE